MSDLRAADQEPILVTIKSATKITGLGRSTLYRLLGEGKLTGKKNGARLLITMESIRAMVAAMPDAKIRKAAR